MKRFAYCFAPILVTLLFFSSLAWAGETKSVKTKYTEVFYLSDRDFDDFMWRLSGRRLEFPPDTAIVSNRIDGIVDRVQTILDMWPERFKVNVYLERTPSVRGETSFFNSNDGSVHILIDYASDGVFAHEVAHAVINQYFGTRPPSKAQEILTQYVDKHLWSDY